MRWAAPVAEIDVVPNGVDADYFRPEDRPEVEHSCVFWGRLDFGPNIQALEWFCRRVWPSVRRAEPAARFTIYGFKPTGPVRALAGRDGVELVPDLPDLRAEIGRHQVVVLPFVSGGGIKNKLLEAAAMGKAVVGSPVAANGLHLDGNEPLMVPGSPCRWREAILGLWNDPARRHSLGAAAREWVIERHTWDAAARRVEDGLGAPVGGDQP
jgi:glycosyltransferase involved in cell wall biosynthesis